VIALRYTSFGEPAEVIAPSEIPMPAPGKGEVRLRMLRSPIHNHDLATIRGTYGYKPALPATAGSEMLGVVDALGSGTNAAAIGTRVACMTHGTWAEYAIAHASSLVPVPPSLGDDAASQLLAMPLSAIVLFDELKISTGDWIALNAAGGAVARILLTIAREHGVNVLALVRSAKTADALRAEGVEHVIAVDREGWQTEARELTGGNGFARIIDSVAGPQALELQRLLAPGGELIVFGGLSRALMKLDPGLMISAELRVRGFWMSRWMMRATAAEREGAMRRFFGMAETGRLPLAVSGIFPLNEAKHALQAAEQPGRAGKVLFKAS
jgi:NADPH:quinone reductase